MVAIIADGKPGQIGNSVLCVSPENFGIALSRKSHGQYFLASSNGVVMSALYGVAFARDIQLKRGRLAHEYPPKWSTWRMLLAPLQDPLSQPYPQ
jgi:hypothetical protein